MGRKSGVFVSAGAAFLLGLPAVAAVPTGFVDEAVAAVSAPTAIAFTPDGRMLVTTQPGQLQVRSAPYASAVTALDLSALAGVGNVVCASSERGLLGVAVDLEFAANRYVFLYYTFNGPNGCKNRVARFVLPDSNTVDPASQVVLVDNIPSTAGNHNAGDLPFGRDGYLYATIGDGGCDYANDSGCAGTNDASRDEHVLTGKILRLTRDGGIPADNPFQGAEPPAATSPAARPRAAPARRPSPGACAIPSASPSTRSAATRFFVNDVGQGAWEEMDLGEAGVDFGWNCREGDNANPQAGASCAAFPAASPYRPPVYEYGRGTGCGSITGGAFVPRGAFSAEYDGHYLFADYNCGKVLRLSSVPAADNTAVELASGLGPVVHLRFGPAGSAQALYYTTYNYPGQGSQVRRIRYTGSASRAPVAAVTAQPSSGAPPLLVTLDGSGSSDPDGNLPLQYLWSFGDGSPDLETTAASTTHTYAAPGTFVAALRVRDTTGLVSDPATALVNAGNTAPSVEITSPSAAARFRVGQSVTVAGSATDPEDGPLPGSVLAWTVLLHHGEHTHPFLGPLSGASIALTYPSPEDLAAAATSYLEVRLTATDRFGASATATLDLRPRKVDLAFATSPAGLRLALQSAGFTAPRTVTSWEGYALPVDAPHQVDAGGSGRVFASWSDGGAQSHVITTPATPTTYTATFAPGAVLTVGDTGVYEGDDGTRDAVFTVRVAGAATGAIGVDWATQPGTASPTDYQPASGRLSFAPGVASQDVRVAVNGDSLREPNVDFFVALQNASGAVVAATGRGRATIVDDDTIGVLLDGDGKADLVWHNQATGDLYAWMLDGTVVASATFLQPSRVADTAWQVRALVDLDNDLRPDLLWHNQRTGDLYVWFTDGPTTLKGASFLVPSPFADTRWHIRGVADLDVDGHPDLLWHNQTTGELYVWFMSGLVAERGGLPTPARVADTRWRIRGLVDLNGDSRPDLLWHHSVTGELYAWFLNGTTATGGARLTPDRVTGSDWVLAQVADFDRDGKADLLWHNRRTGDLYAWFLDGTVVTSGSYLTPSRFASPDWFLTPR